MLPMTQFFVWWCLITSLFVIKAHVKKLARRWSKMYHWNICLIMPNGRTAIVPPLLPPPDFPRHMMIDALCSSLFLSHYMWPYRHTGATRLGLLRKLSLQQRWPAHPLRTQMCTPIWRRTQTKASRMSMWRWLPYFNLRQRNLHKFPVWTTRSFSKLISRLVVQRWASEQVIAGLYLT